MYLWNDGKFQLYYQFAASEEGPLKLNEIGDRRWLVIIYLTLQRQVYNHHAFRLRCPTNSKDDVRGLNSRRICHRKQVLDEVIAPAGILEVVAILLEVKCLAFCSFDELLELILFQSLIPSVPCPQERPHSLN